MTGPTASALERKERRLRATDWLLRLRDPTISPAEICEWLAWCDASPENRRVFNTMRALWERAGAVPQRAIDAEAMAEDTYDAHVSVQQWRTEHAAQRSTLRRRRTRRMVQWSAAASLLMALAAGVAWLNAPDRDTRDVTFATTTGVHRKVVLPDGTAVTLAGGSKVATRYSNAAREIFLERGEAFFTVKKDARRPFAVHALDTTVTAVGTAFNVRAEEGLVSVAVTEGIVNVDRRGRASSYDPTTPTEELHISAGHQVTLSRLDASPIVVSVDAAQATSWVSGTLRFVDEPLSSVVAAINRYSVVPVTLADVRLGDLRYTGTVVAARVDEWLRGLPDVFPVVMREQPVGGVAIDSVPIDRLDLTGVPADLRSEQ